MDLNRASACTYPLREKSLDYALRVIAEAGFRKVDLWGRPPHFSTLPNRVKPSEIEKLSAQHGLQVANLGTYCGRDFAERDRLKRYAALSKLTRTIDLAARFGARTIRVVPGIGEDPKIIPDLARDFQQAALYGAQKGIYLGMENHAGSLAGNPEHARALCERVGSAFFGVVYEPCNLLHAKVDYKQAFETLKDWIVHVHIKDGAWVDEAFQTTHLGQGQVDVRWVVDALEGIDYGGDYALEYEIGEIEPVETGLVKWREFWERL